MTQDQAPPFDPNRAGTPVGELLAEKDQCARKAAEGDAAAACRLAEIYELLGDEDKANTWWRTAAELGDQDAIDYVRAFLS